MNYALLVILSLSFSGCVGMYVRENTYSATTAPATINGAQVQIALKPMGGDSYGSVSAMVVGIGAGKTDGPFIWRVEGQGQAGIHRDLYVNHLMVETSATQRSEPYDKKLLNFRAEFSPLKKEPQSSFANYQIPGKLKVYPETDGTITVTAQVTVTTYDEKVESKTIKATLHPKSFHNYESVFIPTEIYNSFGAEDPTEWKW